MGGIYDYKSHFRSPDVPSGETQCMASRSASAPGVIPHRSNVCQLRDGHAGRHVDVDGVEWTQDVEADRERLARYVVSSSAPSGEGMPESEVERDARDRLDRYSGGVRSWDVWPKNGLASRRMDLRIVLNRLAKAESEIARLTREKDGWERSYWQYVSAVENARSSQPTPPEPPSRDS